MKILLRSRSPSTTTVVLVLLITTLLEADISYQMTFGRLASMISVQVEETVRVTWLAVRVLAALLLVVVWIWNQQWLFRTIIAINTILTVTLITSTVTLVDLLFKISHEPGAILLGDVALMAAANILVFSVWYWIIDPPGIDEKPRVDEPWDFLFPQRAGPLPHCESWTPRYADYLYVAFTTTLAFSPTDTMPLTRRAKLLMLLQTLISTATIIVIAGSAINNL